MRKEPLLRPPLDLRLPRERGRSWGAMVVNIVLHSLLLLVTIRPWLPPARPLVDRDVFLLQLPSEGPQAVEMVYLTPAEGLGQGEREGVTLTRPPSAGVVPEVVIRDPVPQVRTPELVIDTGRTAPVRLVPVPGPAIAGGGPGRLGPARGQGTLWVQPLPLPPRELAQRLTRSHIELVDSAVSAIVQAYIDSVASTPSATGALPSWTTDIEGQTFGIDSKYIYLGPLKIPSAILALLPIPGGGNADLQEGRRLAAIRADLAYAVRRAETMDEFKKAIKEIRERREREREFERNQRLRPPTPPDTGRR